MRWHQLGRSKSCSKWRPQVRHPNYRQRKQVVQSGVMMPRWLEFKKQEFSRSRWQCSSRRTWGVSRNSYRSRCTWRPNGWRGQNFLCSYRVVCISGEGSKKASLCFFFARSLRYSTSIFRISVEDVGITSTPFLEYLGTRARLHSLEINIEK